MQIIRQFNPVTIYHDYVSEHNKHRVELNLYFEDIVLNIDFDVIILKLRLPAVLTLANRYTHT